MRGKSSLNCLAKLYPSETVLATPNGRVTVMSHESGRQGKGNLQIIDCPAKHVSGAPRDLTSLSTFQLIMSFRRFIYGNLVMTFTSSKRYSLVVFLPARQNNSPGKQFNRQKQQAAFTKGRDVIDQPQSCRLRLSWIMDMGRWEILYWIVTY